MRHFLIIYVSAFSFFLLLLPHSADGYVFQWDKADTELYSTHAEGEWRTNLGDASVAVAILGDGIPEQARGMLSHYVRGHEFVSPTTSCASPNAASVLAGNTADYRGVAPNITVLDVPIAPACDAEWSMDNLASAIVWAASNAAKLILMAVNPPVQEQGECPSNVQAAIFQALQAGVMVIVPAGSGGPSLNASLYAPCNCLGAVCVAATTRNGSLAAYSRRGEAVTISAPGDNILVLNNSGPASMLWSSTQAAASNVAGLLALYWHDLLRLSAIPLAEKGSGRGILTSVNAIVPSASTQTSPCKYTSFARTAAAMHCVANGTLFNEQHVYECKNAIVAGSVYLFWSANRWWYNDGVSYDKYWAAASNLQSGDPMHALEATDTKGCSSSADSQATLGIGAIAGISAAALAVVVITGVLLFQHYHHT
jgi:hypothetical protein